MKVLKVIGGVILGLVIITLVTETVELLVIKIISGESFAWLRSNQHAYFEVRNRPLILVLKFVYTFIAAFLGGFVAIRIASGSAKICLTLLIIIQVAGLIYGGFFSEFADTGPLWMWLALMGIVPAGIYTGYLQKLKQ